MFFLPISHLVYKNFRWEVKLFQQGSWIFLPKNVQTLVMHARVDTSLFDQVVPLFFSLMLLLQH